MSESGLNRLKTLQKNSFVRAVAVLTGGTAFAQVLLIAILPVLTRLYTPQDFAVLASYSAILSILTTVACGRLEVAIPLPHADEDAINVLGLALSCVVLTAVGTLAVLLMVYCLSPQLIINYPAGKYLWLLAVGVLLSGGYNAFQYWTTRKKNFSIIAGTRIVQAVSSGIVQIGLGILSFAPIGLILGQIFALSTGVGRLMKETVRSRLLPEISFKRSKEMLRRYSRFPKYSVPEALTESAASQLPIVIIASIAVGPEAGYLFLAMKVMEVPTRFLGAAISQVFLAKAADEYSVGRLTPLVCNLTGALLKSGGGAMICIGIAAPVYVPLLFGVNWARTGEIISWMIPWFFFQFLVSPISTVLYVTENQRLALGIQVFSFILRIGALLTAMSFFRSHVVETYAISGAFFYLIYFYFVLKVSGVRLVDFFGQVRASWKYLMLWSVLGGAAVAIVKIFALDLVGI